MEEARLDWRRTGRAVGELLRENTPVFPLEEDYEPWNSSRPIFVAKYIDFLEKGPLGPRNYQK
jgi:hypothetical protein